MNERIKDLALECIVENIASPAWVFTNAEFEKFAELIIQDCVNIANAYVRTEARPTARSAIGREIQRHFGVEQ